MSDPTTLAPGAPAPAPAPAKPASDESKAELVRLFGEWSQGADKAMSAQFEKFAEELKKTAPAPAPAAPGAAPASPSGPSEAVVQEGIELLRKLTGAEKKQTPEKKAKGEKTGGMSASDFFRKIGGIS